MNVWDKLWKEKPKSFYKEMLTYGHFYEAGSEERWREKVKAEGDKLKIRADRLKQCEERMMHFKEKAEIYDAHEWVTKETPDGETLEIYHLEELATAADKIKAVKNWLIEAKAEGRISMSAGYSLGLRLGVEE